MTSKSRARASSSHPRWAIPLLAVLLVGTVVLTVAAVAHGRPSTPNPRPEATNPGFVEGSSPTPTPSPELVEGSALPLLPREQERFLLFDAEGTAWRAVAGSCETSAPPLLERSADAGVTWNDVTPRYLGITQIAAVVPFAPGQAEIIAAVGPDCAAQGLRTYTQGTFWEEYPDVLDGVAYLPPSDPASAVTPLGAPPAPCSEPTSLSVDGDVAALICDTMPYIWTGSQEWVELAAGPARGLLVSADTVTLARVTAECAGVAMSTISVTDPSSFRTVCRADIDQASAVALAAGPDGVVLWSGGALTPVD